MSKPQEILDLEEVYRITLKETKNENDIMNFQKSNLYFFNDEQEIIGLNLNHNKITEIKSLDALTKLCTLNISYNQIVKIENLEKLTNLSILNISGNQITKIEKIENLTNLSILDISSNQIAKIENFENLTNLSKLYISNNQIAKIENLENLTNLSILYISNNQIAKIENLENLTNLSILYISGNQIAKIENLENLTNLSKLDISSNQIAKIENLENLTNLSKLYILYNQIAKIENLEKLTNLSKLDISDNQIAKIEKIENLTNLSILNISRNQIAKIEKIENLTNLYKLDISYNQIAKIEKIENLTNLYKLDISYNQIAKIENLENLTNLSELDISNNQIAKIENLEKLTNLSELDISYNQIAKIENLEKLTNLSILNISRNQIAKIEKIENLTNLYKLDISYNQISEIDFLKLNSQLEYLKVHQNPFVEAENLILKNHENHLDTVKSSLQKLEELKNDEVITLTLPVKVMLLGNHASGKSTVLKYLQTQQCSKVNPKGNHSTHVLSVVHSKRQLNKDLPEAIFYDFGGQDYYHGIYRAFFTQETVNLLVWHPKSNENKLLEKDSNSFATRNYRRDYWLAQLQYAFDKKNTDKEKIYDDPVLLIQTRADEDAAKENWQEAFLKHNIVDEFHLSLNIDYENAKNEAALHYLTAAFWDTVKKKTSTKKEPEWYPEFLSYIVNKKNPKAISLDTIIDYYERKVTNKFTLEDKKDALRADLEQLSRKGLLLYYKEDELLNDVAWLNPAATVEKIHKTILNKEKIGKFKGKLTPQEFEALKATEEIDDRIEHLLINEKVLFFDKGNNEYIIPNYLPLTSEDDDTFNLLKFDFSKPTFVLKFERFIPFGFINQLICYYGQNPERKQYWRDQLIFTYQEDFKVWIQLDFSKLTISVSVKSKQSKNPKLNEVVKLIFREIMLLYWGKGIDRKDDIEGYDDSYSDEYEKEKTKLQQYQEVLEETSIPNDLYISTDNEYFAHYNTLDNPKKTQETVPAYQLKENNLDKDKVLTQRSYRYRNFTNNPNIQQMKKIFISYSRKDVEYKDELRKHLNMLKLFDVADNWSCEDITIGKWHDQIQKELEESDLVIFMLSINFFNSKYILEKEVQKTMDAIAKGSDKKVYCVIVSDFPGLDLFDQENLTEEQKSILKLSTYQYGMYARTENRITRNKEERITSLKEASRKGTLDEQLTKIAEKILIEIKGSKK